MLKAIEAAWLLAAELDPTHPLRMCVALKRAKAHHDFGFPNEVVAALAPVLEEDLFAVPMAVRAIPRIARLHQDQLGYGNPTVTRLWERLVSHHKEQGDRVRWASTMLELAWDAACRGSVGDLSRWLDPVRALTQSDLVDCVSRHPRAADGQDSASWLHLEASHTELRATTWRGDASGVRDALEECHLALEELGLRSPPPSIHEALAEANLHYETPLLPGFGEAVSEQEGFRRAFGLALIARSGMADILELGRSEGPEWELAVRFAGVVTGEIDPATVSDLARKTQCTAFLRLQAGDPSPDGRQTPATR